MNRRPFGHAATGPPRTCVGRVQTDQGEPLRHPAETALAHPRNGEGSFWRFLECHTVGFMIGDAEHVIEADDAYLCLLGYDRNDLSIGRLRWESLLAPKGRATLTHALHEALLRSCCTPIECVQNRKDGSEVLTLMGLALLERDPPRYVGFVFDLTQHTRGEDEHEEAHATALALREIERCKDEFLGVVSHELKTPLTCLHGYMQLLAQRFMDLDPRQASVEDLARDVDMARTAVTYAARSVDRITRVVEDLLDATRIREGRLEFQLRPCDLGTIVEQAVEEQRLQASDRIIRLEQPAAQGAPIMADALRIGEVVINLLTNALKYSPEHKPVTVRLQVAGRSARVFVHDEGVGIALADQARIWDRFQHAAGVAVQSGSGVSLGLGLYISRTIVERHHGQVGVSSAPGEGSTFWFTLPLAESAA